VERFVRTRAEQQPLTPSSKGLERNTARSFRGKLSEDLRLQSAATMVSANRSPNDLCFYCGVQFRSKDVGAPKFCARISQGHGPPTSDEIIAYGAQPTPGGQPAHHALSLDSPRAHEKCARWMHAINLVVASVRRVRSAGIDERLPAVRKQRRGSNAAAQAAQLAQEAAAMGVDAGIGAEAQQHESSSSSEAATVQINAAVSSQQPVSGSLRSMDPSGAAEEQREVATALEACIEQVCPNPHPHPHPNPNPHPHPNTNPNPGVP
jgi:hypothetical protein